MEANARLAQLNDLWLRKIELAEKHKQSCFQDDADVAMSYFSGPIAFVQGSGDKDVSAFVVNTKGRTLPNPTFKVTVNKYREMVDLFLPVLHYRNPVRTVTPRRPNIPPLMIGTELEAHARQVEMRDQARSEMLSWYLNYTPHELDYKGESRAGITEGLIKGRGVTWTGIYNHFGQRLVGSFYDSVDNLGIDPDVERVRDATFIYRKRRQPHWQVEQKFGWPENSLKKKATDESKHQEASTDTRPNGLYDRRSGDTNDLVTYYEVYSRMGFGTRLKGAGDKDTLLEGINDDEQYVYLVICPQADAPLNLNPEFMKSASVDEKRSAMRWHTPFWRDRTNPWPCSLLDFHPVPRQVWPQSHMRPAQPYQQFLNWAYSFLMSRIAVTSRLFLAVPKEVEQELWQKIEEGFDLTMLPLDPTSPDANKLLQFIQHPPVNKDIWDIIQGVEMALDKATGLNELMYGMTSRQMRTASEASLKREMINIRPDDMAECVESWHTEVARKEAIATRYHIKGADVAPLFGEEEGVTINSTMGTITSAGPFTTIWEELVEEEDIGKIMAEMEYRIEAGTSRKPNKDKEVSDIDESAQVLFPNLMQAYQMTGDPTAVNTWLERWARSREMNIEGLKLPDLTQMMQPPPEEGQPLPEEVPQGVAA